MGRTTRLAARLAALVLAVALGAGQALAQSEAGAPPAAETERPAEDANTAQAREHFLHGVELVKAARWGEALSAFERSQELKPHPVVTFNIGACQRAMANYTLARDTLRKALAPGKDGAELPPNLATEARGFLEQIEKTVVRVPVTVKTKGAALAVDGRPLHQEKTESGQPRLVAGVSQPGRGRVPPGRFELVMDPGARVLTLSRKGYSDVVINKSFSSGSQPPMQIELERLPATLKVSSNVRDAIVRVNDVDVGPTPVDVLRPAGTHRVLVSRPGYEDYESSVTVNAGEQTSLEATLLAENVPLTKRWWFWAGAAVVVVGGVVVTYAVTRPDPQPPPYDGGSTGWVARPSGLSF